MDAQLQPQAVTSPCNCTDAKIIVDIKCADSSAKDMPPPHVNPT